MLLTQAKALPHHLKKVSHLNSKPVILHIAVPSPLRRSFDYLPPKKGSGERLQAGQRLTVPFGTRQITGLLLETSFDSELPIERLKPATALLDEKPILSPNLLALGRWASAYYHHPIGDVFSQILPPLLRQGKAATPQVEMRWQPTDQGRIITAASLKRAPKQAQALEILKQSPHGLSEPAIKSMGLAKASLKALHAKGFVEQRPISTQPPSTEHTLKSQDLLKEVPLPLNAEQAVCYRAIKPYIAVNENTATEAPENSTRQTFLIEGITGSGKTEVYLQLIENCLRADLQSLVLVPEIGLTPQLVSRFQHRFKVNMVALHSGLTDRARLDNWLKIRANVAKIIIGTRSAAFIPMVKPGLIIVDEEHDQSFTQQDGFRYSARDVAIMRGKIESVPVVLGSATPSLESLHNAKSGKYAYLQLKQRATAATLPEFKTLDIRKQALSGGLAQESLKAIKSHLQANNQVLIFLNRRGFAPQLVCHQCNWLAQCKHCQSSLTLHRPGQNAQHSRKHLSLGQLHCHHCGWCIQAPANCPQCNNKHLMPLGTGTEQLEDVLNKHCKHHDVLRIDRDSTRSKDAFERKLEKIHAGHPMVLVGTQMLAKGHHFPDVTLVVVVDIDASLFSTDFRSAERIAQVVTQVAGRAGRADKPGQVLLQTQQPDHPLLKTLMNKGYHDVAVQELQQREQAGWPPFTYLGLLRAEAPQLEQSLAFLEEAKDFATQILQTSPFNEQGPLLMGPAPAPMEKKAGRYRAQLLIQADQRKLLHRFLANWIPTLEDSKIGKRVRWSIDIDPSETY